MQNQIESASTLWKTSILGQNYNTNHFWDQNYRENRFWVKILKIFDVDQFMKNIDRGKNIIEKPILGQHCEKINSGSQFVGKRFWVLILETKTDSGSKLWKQMILGQNYGKHRF